MCRRGECGIDRPLGHDLAVGNVDHEPAALAVITPTVSYIAPTDRGDKAGTAVVERKSVEMAAVFSCQPVDESRAPERPEAVMRVGGGEAVEERRDEDEPSLRVDRHVVHVDVAGDMRADRHEMRVVAVSAFPMAEEVLEAPELVEAGEPEAIGIARQTHRTRKTALHDRE